MGSAPLIYNLFPRYFSSIAAWQDVVPHAARMGFTHIFVNPFHATGFSGSLYAVQDYFALNSSLWNDVGDPSDVTPLKTFTAACEDHGLQVVMDLVINHTAKDSILVDEHPEWFMHDDKGRIVSPGAIDPADDSKVTVWEDLARLDHEGTSDRKGLWEYFDRIVRFYQEMNIRCFRCDAAYQVPSECWTHVIGTAKKRYGETLFMAETLGCRPEQIEALKETGFDYLFNSSKWWQFDEPWCLDQHEQNGLIAPSISFPETHDTERVAAEGPGTEEYQRSRYVLAAIFSEGLLMPMSYEYGARIKMDVIRGAPEDLTERRLWDLSTWIADVHRMKRSITVLSEEGHWQALSQYGAAPFIMKKKSDAGHGPVTACVNTTAHILDVDLQSPDCPQSIAGSKKMLYPCMSPNIPEKIPSILTLKPYEIVLLLR